MPIYHTEFFTFLRSSPPFSSRVLAASTLFFCDEHGYGGDGEYCGGNDAFLGRINSFYHEAPGGKYVPRAVLFNLELGVIVAARVPPLGKHFRSGNLVNQNAAAENSWAKAHNTKGLARILLNSP